MNGRKNNHLSIKIASFWLFLMIPCSLFAQAKESEGKSSYQDCRPIPEGTLVNISLDDEPLSVFAKIIGCISRKSIIVNSKLSDVKFSVITPQKVEVSEALMLFWGALMQEGLTIIRHGDALQVVEIHSATHIPRVLDPDQTPPNSDEFFTQTVYIKYARAREIQKALKPIQGPHGRISLHGDSNSLILVNSGVNLRRLRTLIRTLDQPKSSKPQENKEPIGAEAVRKISKGVYEVERARLLSVPKLNNQARLIPAYKNGHLQGFKLARVRKKGFHHALGLRRGDLILKVNGAPLEGPNGLLEILTSTKAGARVPVELDRRGQPLTLEYRFK